MKTTKNIMKHNEKAEKILETSGKTLKHNEKQ